MESQLTRATNGVAVAGIALPVWVPPLEQASATAGQLVPVLSALWLALQIGRFIWRTARGK